MNLVTALHSTRRASRRAWTRVEAGRCAEGSGLPQCEVVDRTINGIVRRWRASPPRATVHGQEPSSRSGFRRQCDQSAAKGEVRLFVLASARGKRTRFRTRRCGEPSANGHRMPHSSEPSSQSDAKFEGSRPSANFASARQTPQLVPPPNLRCSARSISRRFSRIGLALAEVSKIDAAIPSSEFSPESPDRAPRTRENHRSPARIAGCGES